MQKAKIMVIICFLFFVTSIITYGYSSISKKQQKTSLNTLQNQYYAFESNQINISKPEQPLPCPMCSDFKKQNDDFIGWIQIPNTTIDYPIMNGDVSNYYLIHDFEKKKSQYGLPFIDYKNNNTFNDMSTLIYAHNMKDGTMFAPLLAYSDIEYLNEHQNIIIQQIDKINTYEIFATFFTQNYEEQFAYYDFINPTNEKSYLDFITTLTSLALWMTEPLELNTPILMLSTCEYSKKQGRFVVVAKLSRTQLFNETEIIK